MLRISEVVSMNVKAFDWEKKEFVIFPYYEKNAKEKIYSLAGAPLWFLQELTMYIRKYRRTFKDGYLFPSLSVQSKERPYLMAKTWIQCRWNKAVRHAGVSNPRITADGRMYENVRTHSFRKVGITNLIKKHVPLKHIAAFTGQHPATINIYYNMVDNEAARKGIMQDHISHIKLDR